MRMPGFLGCALLAGVACSVERRGDEAGARFDSTGRAPVAAAASPRPASVAQSAPDSQVRAVCAASAATWRTIAGASVRELDTVLTRQDVIEDPALDTVPPPGTVAGHWPACKVEAFMKTGLDSTAAHALRWPASGWVMFPRLTADGPGSQVQVYQRGLVRCQVAGESDPGDDGDSTYVPDPFHREWMLCWRHGRPVVPRDTINLGG